MYLTSPEPDPPAPAGTPYTTGFNSTQRHAMRWSHGIHPWIYPTWALCWGRPITGHNSPAWEKEDPAVPKSQKRQADVPNLDLANATPTSPKSCEPLSAGLTIALRTVTTGFFALAPARTYTPSEAPARRRPAMPRDPLIALVGKPSAGKSTTLNSLTDATSKVGASFPSLPRPRPQDE